MKKAVTFIAAILLLVIPASALDECLLESEAEDIPCRISIGYEPDDPCNTQTARVYHMNGTFLYNTTMSTLGETGFCQFEFNQTDNGTYYANMTTGDTATVVVEDGNVVELLFYFALALSFLLLTIGIWTADDTMKAFSGIVFIITGIIMLTNGFDILNNILTLAVGSSLVGIGAYVFIGTYISSLPP